MLMKPPSMLDDVISQDSENFTVQSKDRSMKNKNGKKENTIRFGSGNNNDLIQKPKENDNQSVYSTGSRKSKDKARKQSTIGIQRPPKDISQHRDDDTHSVQSNGSKHSNKSSKKQNTIMQRPKIQGKTNRISSNPVKNQIQSQPKYSSFRQAIAQPEESIIKILDVNNQSPKPIRYIEPFKYDQKEKREKSFDNKQQKFAPFAKLNNQSDEEIPVYKLQESNLNYIRNPVIVGNKNNYQQHIIPANTASVNGPLVQQSRTVFEQSRMNETKSRRKMNIFGQSKDIDNSSRVSNMIEQSVTSSAFGEISRNKSKSRLRQAFEESRQKDKKKIQESVIPNESHFSSVGTLQEQSRELNKNKPIPAVKNDHMVQLQKKILDEDNDNFGQQSIKSGGLDLSQSQNNGLGKDNKDRDSLIFDFQPEKKKGMSVASRNMKNGQFAKQSDKGLIKIDNHLTSVRNESISSPAQEELLRIKNNYLVSRQLEVPQKTLKDNKKYLEELDLSLSQKPKITNNSLSSDLIFKFEEEEPIQPYRLNQQLANQKPWHQIVPKYQDQFEVIKTVERNQKNMNKNKQIEIIKKQDNRKKNQIQKQATRKIQMQQKEKQLVKQREREQKQKIEAQKATKREFLRIQNQKKQKQNQLRQKEEELRQIQKRIQKQRQIAERQRFNSERQRQQEKKKKEAELRMKQKQNSINYIPFTKDFSEQGSQNSNKSSKKSIGKKKQSSLPFGKVHKVSVKNQSPRAEQSFYEQSSVHESLPLPKQENSKFDKRQQEKNQIKKPKLLSFSDDQNEEKQKSKTDMNFYESQKSIKAPSSRPPLSRKSNTSTSKSKQKKPKQSTLGQNIKKQKSNNIKKIETQKPAKKMTLMERAMQKQYEESSNESNSQDSYRSREDVMSQNSRNSRDSLSSKNSKKSQKKESTIKINLKEGSMINSKQSKPPSQKRIQTNEAHELQMQELQFQREKSRGEAQRQQQIINQRSIVSKNCTYIDQKGRLVQRDLVIKGGNVIGVPMINDSYDETMQRMRRSRQNRRSRSKSRQNKNRLSRKNSKDCSQNSSYYDGTSNASNTFYENSTYTQRLNGASKYNEQNQSNNGLLREFIKPVEQVPNYNKTKGNLDKYPVDKSSYIEEKQQPMTLNEVFGRKNNQPSTVTNMTQSRSRKSLSRTQKSFNKK